MSQNKNNPEDPIEELFQKKAGQFDIPYREEDWLELEKRLDFADRERKLKRHRRWLIAASLLLFALLGYFTYQNYSLINQISEQISEQTETPESAESTSDIPLLDEILAGNNIDEQSGSDSGMETNLPEGEDVKQNDAPITENDESGDGGASFAVNDRAGSELYVNDLPCRNCVSLASNARNVTTSLQKVESQKTGIEKPAIASAYPEPEESRTTSSRVALSFVASPDLSTSGSISNFSNPGYKIGATVEYKLSKNLAVSGGVIQSDVRYTARGDEYNPSGDYWSNSVLPDETLARCIILDIPISLKYNFLNFERSRFFATAGIASYIMLSEEYNFSYKQQYGSNPPQSWSQRTGTGHLFSNAGFSVGFQYDLHEKWSLQAEPFLRVPLKGVGNGNVKLYSIGSFVSLSYRF